MAITNPAGAVVERLAYDPWGKRRQVNGTADTLDAITGQYIDRGFTMHEHLDEMGVINMNGRIYDPLIGRFISADPYIQAPDDLQSHNRYAYVMNNPLNLTDPSGFSWISKTWKKAWKSPIFRAVLGIVVAVVAPAFLVQFGGALFGATIGGVTTLSFAGSVAVGGLSVFAATGTLKGALTGAFTAGLMHGVGTLGNHLGLESGGLGKIALHAGAGCVSSVAGGGSCKSGAISGALGEAGLNIKTDNMITGTIKAAMLGGIGSKIGGGKFSDGATTGAFGYLFNECQHTKACGSGEKELTGPKDSYSGSDPFLDKNGRLIYGGDGKPVLVPMGVDMQSFADAGRNQSTLLETDLYKFRRGGEWDLQRLNNGQFNHRYVDAATVAIGMHAAAANLPLNVSLSIQNFVAINGTYNSGTVYSSPSYTNLPVRNINNTKTGYGLVKYGGF